MNNRSIRRPLALVAVAGVATAALLALDVGVLAAPRAWNIDGWTELIAERGPAAAAMTLLRYSALATATYLLLLGVVTTLVHLARVRWLDAVLALATPRVLRPVLGIVTVATFAAPHAAEASDAVSTAPVMVFVGTTSTGVTTTAAPASDPPTMRRVAQPPPTSTSTTTTSTVPSTSTTAPPATPVVTITMPPVVSQPAPKPTTPQRRTTWTIERGDHLWHVAEAVLADERLVPPSDAQIAAYWRTLIDANRDRFVDPENPDLVFVDQILVLPPVGT